MSKWLRRECWLISASRAVQTDRHRDKQLQQVLKEVQKVLMKAQGFIKRASLEIRKAIVGGCEVTKKILWLRVQDGRIFCAICMSCPSMAGGSDILSTFMHLFMRESVTIHFLHEKEFFLYICFHYVFIFDK